ncbi:MAG: hypothetical protein K1X94_12785 [Sandaracinaceae bacterium]|nr:hypothetical protein [Sandaracinaceae bacterium]
MTRRLPLFALALSLALSLFAACGVTPGQPATAELFLAHSTGTFTTSLGWRVTLREARLVIGSLYLYAPEGDTMARLAPWDLPGLGVSVAQAHGGVDPFGSRQVRLEWLGPESLDLLATEPTALGAMDGSVGPSTDATLAFETLAGELASATAPNHGHHAWIAGTASRTVEGVAESLAFEGGLDVAIGGTENLIEAIASDAEVVSSGRWTLGVDVARWLDAAHFERLAGDTDPRTLTPTSQPSIAWNLGLRDPMTIHLSYAPTLAD